MEKQFIKCIYTHSQGQQLRAGYSHHPKKKKLTNYTHVHATHACNILLDNWNFPISTRGLIIYSLAKYLNRFINFIYFFGLYVGVEFRCKKKRKCGNRLLIIERERRQ